MSPKLERFTPMDPPEPQMTATQYHNQQDFFFSQVERFKKMFEDSTLAKFIIMAGISGVVVAVVELLRVLWLIARYVWKF
jgi:hypothetical protein